MATSSETFLPEGVRSLPNGALGTRLGTRGRMPDFFIVGHPKCGTTALYEMLRGHPQVHMPVKEPWFFVPARTSPAADGSVVRFEEYLALFEAAAPEQKIGEATPSYLRYPAAARCIAELQPRARIIAILREPALFLRSFHLQSVRAHIETETDLRKALELEGLRREGRAIPRDALRPEDLLYSQHVRYVEQLRRYHAVFAPEQVLVLIYDDFRRDNVGTVRQVLRFLEVDDNHPIKETEANRTVRMRSPRIDGLVGSLSHGQGVTSRAIKVAAKALTPRRLRRGALRTIQRNVVYGRPDPPDERLMGELRGRFKGEVVALSEYLDRDLVTLWGYDRID
jgi:hypothetical protein